MPVITLPDGSSRQFESPVSVPQISRYLFSKFTQPRFSKNKGNFRKKWGKLAQNWEKGKVHAFPYEKFDRFAHSRNQKSGFSFSRITHFFPIFTHSNNEKIHSRIHADPVGEGKLELRYGKMPIVGGLLGTMLIFQRKLTYIRLFLVEH